MLILSSQVLLALHACILLHAANAVQLQVQSAESIKAAAATVAYDMMKYYYGNQTGTTPGNLPPPYYWWECGAMFGHMVEYWYYTGDDTYNAEATQAMTFQAGIDGTFMPSNQTYTEGNDDQAFWGFTVMSAAELNFPAPPEPYLSWLAMAQAVFNTQAGRWDTTTCGGGLRWQIFQWNDGYNYKNTIANGGLFMLATRLARFTGNDSYVNWAEKSWDWFSTSVLYEPDTFQINDGTSLTQNCTQADHSPWSYNYGVWLAGLAFLYNHTQDDKWMTPIQGILNTTLKTFFPNDDKIMIEVYCEYIGNCDTDNYTFKSFLMRWLALVTQLVPELAPTIWPYIEASAQGAAGQCDGGTDGTTCGFRWNSTTWDGLYGVGEQMSALAAIDANLIRINNLKPPYTADTGGTSKSDGAAGGSTSDNSLVLPLVDVRPITLADRAGAGILTGLAIAFTLCGAAFLSLGHP